MAKIPTNETECQGKRLLSSSEARSLFETRIRTVEKSMAPTDLPSPPSTPIQYLECIQKRSRELDQVQQEPPHSMEDPALWKRIFSIAKDGGGSYKRLRRSTIHTQKSPRLPPPRTNDEQVSMVKSIILNEDGSNAASIPASNSPSTAPTPPPLEQSTPEPEDDSANLIAQHFIEFSHSKSSPSILKTLCEFYGLKCKYTPISTNKHFRSPPSKCVLDASPSDPSLPPHAHCISHLCPLPGQVGRCLLLDKSLGHICCHWNHEDRETYGAASDEREKENEGRDLRNEGNLGGRYRYDDGAVEDRSAFIIFRVPQPNFFMGQHIKELGTARSDFLAEDLTESEKEVVSILVKMNV